MSVTGLTLSSISFALASKSFWEVQGVRSSRNGSNLSSELLWVLFLNKLGKKMNYPTAEQRGINRNIHNRPKGRGIKPLSAVFMAGLSASGLSRLLPQAFGYYDLC